MSDEALTPELRQALLDDPSAILMDRDLMRAIVGAHEDGVGANVIDIRGRAMTALVCWQCSTLADWLTCNHYRIIRQRYVGATTSTPTANATTTCSRFYAASYRYPLHA